MFTIKPKQEPTRIVRRALAPLIFLAAIGTSSVADEGMWQPHQLPDLGDQLRQLGLAINPENLSHH